MTIAQKVVTVCFVATGLSAVVGGLLTIWIAVGQLDASPGAYIALGIAILVVGAVWKFNSIFVNPVLNPMVQGMVDVLQKNLWSRHGK